MTAGEALVFWLGGFSSDPKYPISGQGGPAYPIVGIGTANNHTQDPIETRKWTFPFDIGRLRPRDDDGFFPGPMYPERAVLDRYIEYAVTINGERVFRRINFWQYVPRKSDEPYLYFDTSRGAPTEATDAPAATEPTGLGPDGAGLHVHTFKKVSESTVAVNALQSINPDKFQVLHCGIDDEWGVETFERMSIHWIINNPGQELLFPNGPFIGDIADTIVNFTPVTRIEDAQP
jgi:hypothetical protein